MSMAMRSDPMGGADIRVSGVVLGVVKEVEDPDRQGRIRVSYPWLDGELVSKWASIAAPMAGKGRGLFSMPVVGDEVVLSFDRGRMNFPLIVGFTWNGMDETPDMDPRVRMWRSVNGHQFMMVDSSPGGGSSGAVIVSDAHGNMITMGNGTVTVTSKGVLRLKAPSIVLEVGGSERIVTPSRKPL